MSNSILQTLPIRCLAQKSVVSLAKFFCGVLF
jgi:hypothetical protein